MARVPIMSSEQVQRTLSRLAYEVVERNRGAEGLIVFGIRTRGAALARDLARRVGGIEGQDVEVHELDVARYRDDRDTPPPPPAEETARPNVTDRHVILVDDVLFTGRTVRAALDALVRFGRPRSIQLAILIDRGHREYPIQPDYVGRTIPTKHQERVVVATEDELGVYVEE